MDKFGEQYNDKAKYTIVQLSKQIEPKPSTETQKYEVCTKTTPNAVKISSYDFVFYVIDSDTSAQEDGSHTLYKFDSNVPPKAHQIVELKKGEVVAAKGPVYCVFSIENLTHADVKINTTAPNDSYVELKTTDDKNVTVFDVDTKDDIYVVDPKDKTKYETDLVTVYFENAVQGGDVKVLFVIFDGTPYTVDNEGETYIVRMEHSCNQEIGDLRPYYLEGYTYENDKPSGTSMKAKLDWQNFQLSALTEYKGVRTALLNKSEIDYRYIVDTFESFIDTEIKSVLSFLTKEKDSALFIGNLPSVKTFLKCPFNSYTDAKGNFNVQYIVDGYNKKKSHTVKLPFASVY